MNARNSALSEIGFVDHQVSDREGDTVPENLATMSDAAQTRGGNALCRRLHRDRGQMAYA